VLLIGFLPGELRTDYGDKGRQCIAQIVDSIQCHGYGIGHYTYNGFEACEQDIGKYAYDARAYDRALSVRRGTVPHDTA